MISNILRNNFSNSSATDQVDESAPVASAAGVGYRGSDVPSTMNQQQQTRRYCLRGGLELYGDNFLRELQHFADAVRQFGDCSSDSTSTDLPLNRQSPCNGVVVHKQNVVGDVLRWVKCSF